MNTKKILRLIIPIGTIVLGLFVVYAIYLASNPAINPQTIGNAPAQTGNANANSAAGVDDTTVSGGGNEGQPVATEDGAGAADGKAGDNQAAAGEKRGEESGIGNEAVPGGGGDSVVDSGGDSGGNSGGAQSSTASVNGEKEKGDKTVERRTAAAVEAIEGLHFKKQPIVAGSFQPMGVFGDKSVNPARIVLDMSNRGAGVKQITLLDYYKTIEHVHGNEYTMLDGIPQNRPTLAIRAITVSGTRLDATGIFTVDREKNSVFFDGPVWREDDSQNPVRRVYTAEIVDGNDNPVLEITRTITLGQAPGEIIIAQSVDNVTDHPLSVQVEQWGASDLPAAHGRYGDYRRFRFGYLDPRSKTAVFADEGDYLKQRNSLLAKQVGGKVATHSNVLWPNETSKEKNYTLSWTGVTNRYFAFIVFPHLDDPANAVDRGFHQVAEVQFYLDSSAPSLASIDPATIADVYANLKLISPVWTIMPRASRSFDMDSFAGPQDERLFTSNIPYRAFHFSSLIIYQLGCAFCTFQWLAHFLIVFLRIIHGVVFDWGLSIIILVFVVRGILHPLTKKGQVSMQRMQKKMGKLQPEIAKLKEKYKDNPKKIQKEQMRLYKEHKVNPVGCLGMAPMMLQMPIWVALYAMLYFAIELRQEPMFYGVFQLFNNWSFLADLSQPDRFINFGHTLPFLSGIPIIGGITSINILPILMGGFFFLQQKYMTPPNPSATPEQQTQQKIMKIIFPLMWPIFLYGAPAGLTMYIMSSSVIGIIEAKYIRAHVTALELEEDNGNGPPKKKNGIASRFMNKYSQRLEEAKATLEHNNPNQKSGGKSGNSKKRKRK